MSDRRQLEQSMKQVTAWVNGAEKLLECRSVDDSDHQNLQNQLEEIKVNKTQNDLIIHAYSIPNASLSPTKHNQSTEGYKQNILFRFEVEVSRS